MHSSYQWRKVRQKMCDTRFRQVRLEGWAFRQATVAKCPATIQVDCMDAEHFWVLAPCCSMRVHRNVEAVWLWNARRCAAFFFYRLGCPCLSRSVSRLEAGVGGTNGRVVVQFHLCIGPLGGLALLAAIVNIIRIPPG